MTRRRPTCRGRDIPVRTQDLHDDTTDGHLHAPALVGADCLPVECSHGSQTENMLHGQGLGGWEHLPSPGEGGAGQLEPDVDADYEPCPWPRNKLSPRLWRLVLRLMVSWKTHVHAWDFLLLGKSKSLFTS